MKLKKMYFNQIKISNTCLFKTMNGEYILCIKYGKENILHNGIMKYTGQEHSCYLVNNITFIDKLFANFQWYLKRKWKKANEQRTFKK